MYTFKRLVFIALLFWFPKTIFTHLLKDLKYKPRSPCQASIHHILDFIYYLYRTLTRINKRSRDVFGCSVFAKDFLTRWLEKPVIKPLNFQITEGCSHEALDINIQVYEDASYLDEIRPKLIKNISYLMTYWICVGSFFFCL